MEAPKRSKTDMDEAKESRAVGSAFFASLKLAPSEHLDVKGKVKVRDRALHNSLPDEKSISVPLVNAT